jgi:hypothetical protein
MQGIYYIQIKLTVDNLTDIETIIDNMDYSIQAKEISETEIVSSEITGDNTILVTVKTYLELDMNMEDAQNIINESNYHFEYHDEKQTIVETEIISVDTNMT